MASGAEQAKNLFDSVFSKTKEVVGQAAESTKGLANQAFENVQKIIPGHNNSAEAAVDPNAVPNTTAPVVPAPPQQ